MNNSEYVLKAISNQSNMDLAPEEVALDTKLTSEYIDSLDLVEIVMKIEDDYHCTVPDEVWESFNTAQDIINYLNDKFPQQV